MKHWNSEFLEQLLQVQDTDLKIRELEQEKHFFYQKSKEEDTELSKLKMKISAVDETLTATESQYQMYFTTLEDIRTAIKGLLTTKSGAPKPRTRSSTEALRIEEEKLATLVEETAEQIQRLKEERVVLIGKAEARAADLEKTQEGPEAEIRKLETKIRRFTKQRESEVIGMPPMLLKHYDRLRSSRSGIGLTILRDGVCTVCRMQMPTAVISRMTKGERVPVCPACGRMVARVEIIDLVKSEKKAPTAAAKKTAKKAQAAKTKAKKTAAKKAPATKPKKTAAKATEKPKAAKKTPAKKTPAKKPAAKKTAKKATAKKSPAKKAVAKKAAKKTTTKKTPAKKPAAKKAAKKVVAKKAAKKAAQKTPAKKTPAKKTPAKKPAAKKAAKKKARAKTSKSKVAPAKKTTKKTTKAKPKASKKKSTKKSPKKK